MPKTNILNKNKLLIIYIVSFFLLTVVISATYSLNTKEIFSTNTYSYTSVSSLLSSSSSSEISSTKSSSSISESTSSLSSVSNINVNATIDAPIIMYHHVDPDLVNSKDKILAGLTVTPTKFENDIKYLIEKGYTAIHPGELLELTKSGQNDKTKKFVIITLDDGYGDNYRNAYPILKKYNVKATIYVIPNLVEKVQGNNWYLKWSEIKEMSDSGLINIGSHTMDHFDMTKLNDTKLRYQVFESKKILEEKTGKIINDFCYPYGYYNDKAVKIVEEAGYTTSTTVVNGKSHNYKDRFIWSRVRSIVGL